MRLHVVEEHFSEGLLAVECPDRANRDAFRIERHQQVRQAVVAAGLRVAAEQAEQPVGEQRARRPGLLAVDDIVVAIADRAARDRGHVGAGVGLAPALRPHVVAARHARQETRLLLGRAELHQCRPEQQDAVLVHAHRCVGRVVLLLEDQPLDQVGTAAAQFLGPDHAAPAALGQRRLPGAVLLEALARVVAAQCRLGNVRAQPVARFGTEGLLLWSELKVHRGCLAVRTWRRVSRRRPCASRPSPGSCRPAA